MAKPALDQAKRPYIGLELKEISGGAEIEYIERLKTEWVRLDRTVGTDKRIVRIAQHVAEHSDRYLEVLDGKAIVVCMSRRICVGLYNNAIIRLRPKSHSDADDEGVSKVVMAGSAAHPPEWQPHIRNEARWERLAAWFRDPNDPLKLVTVREM